MALELIAAEMDELVDRLDVAMILLSSLMKDHGLTSYTQTKEGYESSGLAGRLCRLRYQDGNTVTVEIMGERIHDGAHQS